MGHFDDFMVLSCWGSPKMEHDTKKCAIDVALLHFPKSAHCFAPLDSSTSDMFDHFLSVYYV